MNFYQRILGVLYSNLNCLDTHIAVYLNYMFSGELFEVQKTNLNHILSERSFLTPILSGKYYNINRMYCSRTSIGVQNFSFIAITVNG